MIIQDKMSQKIIYSQAKEEVKAEKRALNQLVKSSERLLFKCKSVFPFKLFPDSILVDQTKIDIIYGNFFFSKSVFTIMIEDIRTVKVHTGPIFASVYFEITGYEQNPEPVSFLPKNAALKMRSIIMGLTAAKRENIKLDNMSQKSVTKKTESIGEAKERVAGM